MIWIAWGGIAVLLLVMAAHVVLYVRERRRIAREWQDEGTATAHPDA